MIVAKDIPELAELVAEHPDIANIEVGPLATESNGAGAGPPTDPEYEAWLRDHLEKGARQHQNATARIDAYRARAGGARVAQDAAAAADDLNATIRDIKFDSLAMVNGRTYPVKKPLFQDLLCPGAWVIVGRPKIGKSWLLLQLLLATCQKGQLFGYPCLIEDAEALAIFAEDDAPRIQSRLSALGFMRAPENGYVITQQNFMGLAREFGSKIPFTEFLDRWLDGHPKVRLVLVDTETTARQVWAGEASSEGAARVTETDYRQTRPFDEIALRRNVVIGLVNHAKKANGEVFDYHELINRSNTALAGASGSIVLADPPGKAATDPTQRMRIFAVRGRDLVDDLVLAIANSRDDPGFHVLGPYEEVKQTEVEREILEAIEQMQLGEDEYVTAQEVADQIGTRREQVKRAISRMLSKPERRTWKQYRVTAKRGKKGGIRLDPR